MVESSLEKTSVEDVKVDESLYLDADAKGNIVEVESAALTAARIHGIDRWSKDAFILYACCVTSFLCACANGYDGSLMTAINIMPFYQDRFNAGVVGSTTGIIFSVYTIGGITSPWIAGPIIDSFGRRAGMFIGCGVICIGTAVISSSVNKGQFIAGRFLLGFGISIATTAAPAYIIEISPPQWRGRMTAFYNSGWIGGSIPAAAITLGTQNIKSDLSWRLPLIFQCIPALIVMFVVWFLPESPRWLLAIGRDEEARAFLARFHGGGNPDHPIVEVEWAEFKSSIATDGADKRWYDYSDLFRTKSLRWRSLMNVMMAVFGQFSGIGLGYFNTQIYAAVGYGTYMQFVLNLASQVVQAAGTIIGVSLADRMPRRKVLVAGTFASACFLGMNGALSARWAQMPADEKNLAIGKAAVASFFLFNFAFVFTYLPLHSLYPVECMTTNGRAKGMAMNVFVVNVMLFINLFCGPIAFANIGYKYVFIFVGWDCIEAILWFLFAVETVGKSLEELEDVFNSPYPPRANVKRKIAVTENGHVEII